LFDARTIVLGFVNVLERARLHGVRRVVYVSSGGVVYGEPDTIPTPESYPKLPLSPYGVGKLAGEHYLAYYAAVHGLNSVALRYSNVYGPRQDPHGEAGVVAIFGLRILAGERITIFGDGEQERDYVYVGDVVEANWLASLAEPRAGHGLDACAWNIGTGRGTSVNELADRLMRISGRDVERISAPERPGELRRSVLDCSKAAAELGWSPRTDLDEGLARTMEHIKKEIR
jgi:UDP-glucose 4-epimerase